MTISADNPYEAFTIVDSNAPLDFPHPFEFNDEIVATQDGVLLEEGTDYSVVGAGAPGGGSVNPVDALVGSKWVVQRRTRLTQNTTPSDTAVGFALDRLTKQMQDVRRDVDRALRISLADAETVEDIPTIEPGKALVGNATGDGFEYKDVAEGITERVDDLENELNADIDALETGLAAETSARIAQDEALLALITGSGDPNALRVFLDIENTDNTSDMDKPVSNAQAAINAALSGALADKLDFDEQAADSALLGGENLAFVLALANATGVIEDDNLPEWAKSYTLVTNLNTITAPGRFVHAPGAVGQPVAGVYGIVEQLTYGGNYFQIWRQLQTNAVYARFYNTATWSTWVLRGSGIFIQASDPGSVGPGAIWVDI